MNFQPVVVSSGRQNTESNRNECLLVARKQLDGLFYAITISVSWLCGIEILWTAINDYLGSQLLC